MKSKILSIIGIFLMLSGVVFCFVPQKVNALDWYNTSWLYRKSITVNGTSTGVQTNYQIPFYVYYGAGTNSLFLNAEPTSGTNIADASTNATQIVDAALISAVNDYYNGRTFYNVTRGIQGTITDYDGASKTAICTSVAGQVATDLYYIQQVYPKIYLNGKCQIDFDDLRFTKSDGITLLHYWIESYTASSLALVWVEFDYIPSSPSQQTFYVYYGNSSVSNVSSGANTFIKFEDFEWSTNTTALSTDGGSIDWSVTAAGTSSVTISTTQAYGGTRSGRFYRDGANNADAVFSQTAGNNYAIRYMARKDNAGYLALLHGNGTYSIVYYADNLEDIYYFGPGAIDTTRNATILTWQQYEITDISFGGTADYWFLDQKIVNNGLLTWASAGISSQIDLRNASGTGEIFIDNVIVRTYTNPEPVIAVWGTEEYFNVDDYLRIDDVEIFQSFAEDEDWLIAIRYLNLYPPYYDTYDVRKLFLLQLIDTTGAVVAQSQVMAWGNKPGSIYLAASSVTSLEWGAAYTIRMYGTFTGNPYVDFDLSAEDWIGEDLTNLDSWVISSAHIIEDYYSSSSLDLTTIVAERGEVLNSTGGAMFELGIPGLSLQRPLIFQTYTITGTSTDLTIDTSYIATLKNWSASWGDDGTLMLNRWGALFGIDGGVIGSMFFLIPMLALLIWAFIPSSSHAASILTAPILVGSVFFGTDPLFIVMLGVVAVFIWIKQWWFDK